MSLVYTESRKQVKVEEYVCGLGAVGCEDWRQSEKNPHCVNSVQEPFQWIYIMIITMDKVLIPIKQSSTENLTLYWFLFLLFLTMTT